MYRWLRGVRRSPATRARGKPGYVRSGRSATEHVNRNPGPRRSPRGRPVTFRDDQPPPARPPLSPEALVGAYHHRFAPGALRVVVPGPGHADPGGQARNAGMGNAPRASPARTPVHRAVVRDGERPAVSRPAVTRATGSIAASAERTRVDKPAHASSSSRHSSGSGPKRFSPRVPGTNMRTRTRSPTTIATR